jgi:transposase
MVPAGVLAEADADAWLKDALARALEANERRVQTAAELRKESERPRAENGRLREEIVRLRERDAQREAELERVNAELAVLQRPLFGRSSELLRRLLPSACRRSPFDRPSVSSPVRPA